MASPLLALFVRSLCQDSFGKATYWMRASLCGFVLFILFAIVQTDVWSGANGLVFFVAIVSLQMVAITLVGLSYFGSAITEEKEDQTLGLLRMTDLNPLSILLGKSTSRLCGALLLLSAIFPFTIFAITLGGTSLGQIVAVYCTIGAYLFLVCNVALLGSVISRHTAGAATFSAALLGTMLAGGPVLKWLDWRLSKFGVHSGLDVVGEAIWGSMPIARLNVILQTRFATPTASAQIVSNLLLGVFCFLLSWAVFGRFCEHSPDPSETTVDRIRRRFFQPRRHRPRPRGFAIAWKDFHFLYGGGLGLAARVLAYLIVPIFTLSALLLSTSQNFNPVLSNFHSYLVLIYFVDTGAMAGRMFRSELNDQTMADLATLPSSIRRLVYTKASVFLLSALPGTLCILGLTLLQYGFDSRYSTFRANSTGRLLVEGVSFLGYAIVLVHIVLWLSLYMKRGALPVGIIACLATSLLVSICTPLLLNKLQRVFNLSFLNHYSSDDVLGIFVTLTASIILHLLSLRRLEVLAAEG